MTGVENGRKEILNEWVKLPYGVEAMARREKDTYTIRSIRNALNLLEEFKGDKDELGVTELKKRLDLHKNRVFRILATLEAKGYIEHELDHVSLQLPGIHDPRSAGTVPCVP